METGSTSIYPSTAGNEDGQDDDMDTTIWVVLLVLFIMIGLSNIVGNLCTAVAFIRDSKLQQVSNYYIFNLAIADLLVGLCSIPVYAAYTLENHHWSLGGVACKVWLTFDYLLCAESSLTIILISLDRFLMVHLGPGRYQKLVTPNRTIAALLVSWVCAFLLYSPAIIGTDLWRGYSTVSTGDCDVEFSDLFHYVVVACVLEFCVPLILVSTFNCLLYRNIHQRTKRLGNPTSLTDVAKHNDAETLRKMRNLKRDRKAARMLFILVVAFFVCWSPYSVTTIVFSTCGSSCVSFHMYEFFTWLLWLNSSLNPYLYAYANTRIRKHFRKYLFPCGKPKPVFQRRVYAVSKKQVDLNREVHSSSFNLTCV